MTTRTLVGPLFGWELGRLQRRGRVQLLRCVGGACLLLTLYLLYGVTFDSWNPFTFTTTQIAVGEMSRFTLRLFISLQCVLGGLILLCAPIYTLDVLAGPKEHGTFEELFLTDLYPREILLGQAAARTVHLLGLLLVSVPFLALLQMWGGISWEWVLLSFWVNGWALLSSVAVALMFSALASSVLMATLGVLAWHLCVSGCLGGIAGPCATPLHFWFWAGYLESNGWMTTGLLIYGGYHVVVTLLALKVAMSNLRPTAESGLGGPQPVPAVSKSTRVEPIEFDPTPVYEHSPIWWKERHFGWSRDPAAFMLNYHFAVPVVCLMFSLGIYSLIEGQHRSFLSGIIGFSVGLVSIVAGLRTVRAICVERQQQTLTGLLMLPVARYEILVGKWLGTSSVLTGLALGLLVSASVAVYAQQWSAPLALWYLFAAAVEVSFFVTFALWLSVWVPRLTQGVLLFIASYLATAFLPGSMGEWCQSANEAWLQNVGVWLETVAPWTVWRDWVAHRQRPPFANLFLSRCLFVLLTGILWADTCRRFRRLEG